MARDTKDLEALVLVRVVRLNAVVTGVVTGLLAGLALFVATNWLVLKGGPVVGPHLALLGPVLHRLSRVVRGQPDRASSGPSRSAFSPAPPWCGSTTVSPASGTPPHRARADRGSPDGRPRPLARLARGLALIVVAAGIALRFLDLGADPYYHEWNGYITDEGRWIDHARALTLFGDDRLGRLLAPPDPRAALPGRGLRGLRRSSTSSLWSARLVSAVGGSAAPRRVLGRLPSRGEPRGPAARPRHARRRDGPGGAEPTRHSRDGGDEPVARRLPAHPRGRSRAATPRRRRPPDRRRRRDEGDRAAGGRHLRGGRACAAPAAATGLTRAAALASFAAGSSSRRSLPERRSSRPVDARSRGPCASSGPSRGSPISQTSWPFPSTTRSGPCWRSGGWRHGWDSSAASPVGGGRGQRPHADTFPPPSSGPASSRRSCSSSTTFPSATRSTS